MKRLLRIIVLLAVPVLTTYGLVQPFSGTDKSGTSSAQQVAASGYARWVLFVTCQTGTVGCTANANAVRVGGSNVSSTVGAPIAPGGGLFFPPVPVDFQQPVQTNNYYDLTAIYVYVVTGDKVSVLWGN